MASDPLNSSLRTPKDALEASQAQVCRADVVASVGPICLPPLFLAYLDEGDRVISAIATLSAVCHPTLRTADQSRPITLFALSLLFAPLRLPSHHSAAAPACPQPHDILHAHFLLSVRTATSHRRPVPSSLADITFQPT